MLRRLWAAPLFLATACVVSSAGTGPFSPFARAGTEFPPSSVGPRSALVPSDGSEPAGAAATPTDDPATILVPETRGELFARYNAARGDPYPLDSLERFVETDGRRKPKFECDASGFVNYAGSGVRYAGAVRVHPAFRERLERLDAVVVEVATEVYGRAPRRLLHYGAYSCRSSRQRAYRMSEHALGNAFDLVGFDFAGVGKKVETPADLPRGLRGPFQVRVAKHWSATATDPASQLHRRFLHALTDRLHRRGDVFRILIGPGHGNHDDHFHFDMSPWHYVDL